MIVLIFKRVSEFIKLTIAERSNLGKINYLKKRGTLIGEGVTLNCKISAFGTEPYLVKIGDECLFAADVRFITHDGGVDILNKNMYFGDKKMDKIAPVIIGNRVYIGTGAYIMPGVTIGDNVVIGAGAIVVHDIPNNSVAVGVPAKVIESIDEYYQHGLEKNVFYPTKEMSKAEKKEYFTKNNLLLK
jgi:acetyltransferase-like isoleucine patch superfamily enzyme